MRKKITGIIILGISFLIFQNKINASLYTYDFMSDSENILKCTYKEKRKKVNLSFSLRNGTVQADLTVDGKDKSEDIIIDAKDKPNENTMTQRELLSYINENGKCPQYVAEIDSGYTFSDSQDALKDSKTLYTFNKIRYSKNYCLYKFEINSNVEGRPMPIWGLFVNKNKFSNFENNYTSESCPETVVTELFESTNEDSGFNRKFYAAEKSDEQILSDLVKQCEDDAKKQMGELYPGESYASKCFKGTKVETKSTESGDTEETEEELTPLTCEALFDEDAKKFITGAYFFIEIIAVLMVIGLTIKDYAAAILNSNADEMKKANKRLITRLIVLAIILLLPGLLNLIVKVFNISLFSDDPLCGTLQK